MVSFTIENRLDSMKYNIAVLSLQMKNSGTERSGNLTKVTNLGILAQESVLLATMCLYWYSAWLSLVPLCTATEGVPLA